MKQLTCEMCGSTDLIKQDGLFVCQACGTKYSVEEAKKMMIEGTVEVQGTVRVDSSDKLENLYTLARRAKEDNDSESAQKYYEQIVMEKPDDWEAQFYTVYYSCMNVKIAQMGSSCIRLGNSIDSIFSLIKNNISEETERKKAYNEIYSRIIRYNNFIISNINSSSDNYSDASYALQFMKEHSSGLCIMDAKVGDAFANVGMKSEALNIYKGAESGFTLFDDSLTSSMVERIKKIDPNYEPPKKKGGCYVATAVYGSYDCPEVWTLRRYRDYDLAESWYGRAFIKTYYAVSPTIVKWFGHSEWFKKMWRGKLDKMVLRLQKRGYESTPYDDRKW